MVPDIMNKLIHDSPNPCGCLTLNEMHIKLASLIISLTNNNLANTSSTHPPEVKKNSLYTVHIIILCTSAETSTIGNLKIKSLTSFEHQINITAVLLSCGSFFNY